VTRRCRYGAWLPRKGSGHVRTDRRALRAKLRKGRRDGLGWGGGSFLGGLLVGEALSGGLGWGGGGGWSGGGGGGFDGGGGGGFDGGGAGGSW
jgi:uncharacterized protein